jgi:uncharacterized membrane protein YgdD (TMEM256/DUF423 family)
MIRAWLAIAASVGFFCVAMGAMAAHLAFGERTMELLRTGAYYGMVHAAVLIAVVAMGRGRDRPDLALTVAGWSFAVGMLFSLGIFGLALTGSILVGRATPLGGVGLLIGWVSLALHALWPPR